MKNKIILVLFLIIGCNFSMVAQELNIESTPVSWLDSREVSVVEEKSYFYTNLGSVLLKIVEYDEQGKRYLVECIKYEDYYYPQPEIFLEPQN